MSQHNFLNLKNHDQTHIEVDAKIVSKKAESSSTFLGEFKVFFKDSFKVVCLYYVLHTSWVSIQELFLQE